MLEVGDEVAASAPVVAGAQHVALGSDEQLDAVPAGRARPDLGHPAGPQGQRDVVAQRHGPVARAERQRSEAAGMIDGLGVGAARPPAAGWSPRTSPGIWCDGLGDRAGGDVARRPAAGCSSVATTLCVPDRRARAVHPVAEHDRCPRPSSSTWTM